MDIKQCMYLFISLLFIAPLRMRFRALLFAAACLGSYPILREHSYITFFAAPCADIMFASRAKIEPQDHVTGLIAIILVPILVINSMLLAFSSLDLLLSGIEIRICIGLSSLISYTSTQPIIRRQSSVLLGVSSMIPLITIKYAQIQVGLGIFVLACALASGLFSPEGRSAATSAELEPDT